MKNRFNDSGLEHLISQLQTLTSLYNKAQKFTPDKIGVNWGEISGSIQNQTDLIEYLNALKEELIGQISCVFTYKGSVASVSDLPTNAEIGDCYNVEDTGANYAYNGQEWDKLSETISLDGYITQDDLEQALNLFYIKGEVDELINNAVLLLDTNKADKTALLAKADKTDVDLQGGKISALTARLDLVEDKVANLNKVNIEPVAAEDAVNVNDETKDYIISGEINSQSTIKGKSATIKDTDINQAVVNLTAEDVDIKGTDIAGTYNKGTQGNSMMNIHSDGYITIKDCTISATGYNCLEIGLTTGLAKNVLIDNVQFTGKFTNNAISVYGMADDGIITISNCHFEDVSNILRLSNTTGCKCTVNLINCSCDKWETGNYAGAIICQDYTSKTAEETAQNNLFKNMTINIQNLIKPDGTKLEKVEDISTICGSGNNQILYLYGDKVGIIAYNEDRYPTLNII